MRFKGGTFGEVVNRATLLVWKVLPEEKDFFYAPFCFTSSNVQLITKSSLFGRRAEPTVIRLQSFFDMKVHVQTSLCSNQLIIYY